MAADPIIRRRVVVRGRVQGVWFRDSTRRVALSHGAAGWVRNLSDGRVEAVVEGPPPAVAAVVAFCRTGPRGARVEAIEIAEEAPTGATGFEIR